MEIKSVSFLMSNTQLKACPEKALPEYAFIGRSNVGKSSLINMLMQRKELAKVSGKPGKTRLINHFIVNDNWYLADLPGYGYAKVSKSDRAVFHQLITRYILNRQQLVCLFVLIDVRHAPMEIDLEFLEYLGVNQIPFAMVFTKSDKIGPKAVQDRIKNYNEVLLKTWEDIPQQFISSATTGEGREEILDYISELNRFAKLEATS